MADANKHRTISQADHLISLSSSTDRATNYQTNNAIFSQQDAPNTAHHVSLCVDDQRTTLYIDEDTLNSDTVQALSSNLSTRRKGISSSGSPRQNRLVESG